MSAPLGCKLEFGSGRALKWPARQAPPQSGRRGGGREVEKQSKHLEQRSSNSAIHPAKCLRIHGLRNS
eukprot:4883953-Pyramimonas_sp.AAC.1